MPIDKLFGGVPGALFGGGGGTKANVPGDLVGLRHSNIHLLNQLLGFGGPQGAPRGDPTSRLESFFGPLTSPLQRQGLTGMENFLNQPAPETRAFDQSLPALQNILGNNPGQGFLDALQPYFQQNLISANQQGDRFSSGNATLKAQAVNDYNMLGAQAWQQGVGQQLQAAQVLGLLGQSAGNNPFNRFLTASQNDPQGDRRIALLQQLLGTAQSATLSQPTTVTPSGTQQAEQSTMALLQLLPFLMG